MIETNKVLLTKNLTQPKAEKSTVKVGHQFQEAMQRYQQTKSHNLANNQSATQEHSVAQKSALTDENKQEKPEMVTVNDEEDQVESAEEKLQIDENHLNDALFAQLANPIMPNVSPTQQSTLQEVEINQLVPTDTVQTDESIATPYTVVSKQVDVSTMELTINQAIDSANATEEGNQPLDSIDINNQQMSINQTKLDTEINSTVSNHSIETLNNDQLKKVDSTLSLVVDDPTAMVQVGSLQNDLKMLNERQTMLQPASFKTIVEHNQPSVAEALTHQVAQKLVEQTQTLTTPGMQKVTIQLYPDQLGKLEISLQLNQHQVQLEVKAENSQTMKLLENLSAKFEQILNKQQFLQQPTPLRLEIPSQNEGLGSALQQNFQQNFQQSNVYQSKPVNRYSKATEKMVVEEEIKTKEILDSTISILA